VSTDRRHEGLTLFLLIFSQTTLNSLPRTKLGSVIVRRPKTRMGIVISRPKNERGVISPYPTVDMAGGTHTYDQATRRYIGG
jgi:hypothetical protein